MYSNEEKAIKFVVKAFENKKRIKENIDMSFHSITVGFMLKNIGCDETTVISGLLHDIIEDTEYDYDYIKNVFNNEIADNVLMVSEDKTILDWKKRKESFLKNISNQEKNIMLIELADKLHNLVTDYDLWKIKGSDALSTLSTTYEMNKWFYLEFRKIFNEKIDNNVLLERYNNICDIYFGDE